MAKRSIPALSRTAKDCARNREGRRLAIGKLDALLSSRRLVQRVSDDQPHGNSGACGVGLSCSFLLSSSASTAISREVRPPYHNVVEVSQSIRA